MWDSNCWDMWLAEQSLYVWVGFPLDRVIHVVFIRSTWYFTSSNRSLWFSPMVWIWQSLKFSSDVLDLVSRSLIFSPMCFSICCSCLKFLCICFIGVLFFYLWMCDWSVSRPMRRFFISICCCEMYICIW